MNRVLAAVAAICAAVVLCSGVARADDSLAVTNDSINASSQHEAFTELLPIEVSQAPDKLEIRKVYELDPNVDPGLLPRDGFERSGVVYTCADILREVVIGEESKIVTATETTESKRNDMDTILTLLPQSKEFVGEDGFVGTLRLNAATIRAVEGEYGKRKAVFIDEIWKLIGASSNRQAAEFCLEIFKIIRGYGGGAIAATQDLSDFFGLEDGKYGRAILNNSKTKIVLNLEPDEAQYVRDVLKLSRTELRSITQFERGEALISSNNNKIPVVVKVSKAESEMITTDRAELAAILREKKDAGATAQGTPPGS